MKKKISFILGFIVSCILLFLKDNIGKKNELSDANFVYYTGVGKTITRNSFVLMYDPKCIHCKSLHLMFDELVEKVPDVGIFSIDCTENRKTCRQFQVYEFPTLIYFTKDNQYFKYKRQKNIEAFIKFVTQAYKGDNLQSIKFNVFETEPIYQNIAYLKAAVINSIVNVGGIIPALIIVFLAVYIASFLLITALIRMFLVFNKSTQSQQELKPNQTDNKKDQ